MEQLHAPVPGHVNPRHVTDINVYALPDTEKDFHTAWMRFLGAVPDDAEFIWSTQNGGHWIAVRAQAVQDVFSDHAHFSSSAMQVPKERGQEYNPLPQSLDPPEHRGFRNLINPALSPKSVRDLEPSIRATSIELIESFLDRGHCEFIQDYCFQLPIRVFMRMVDLPMSDATMLKELSDEVVRPEKMTIGEVYGAFHDYLDPYMEERKTRPKQDLISDLVNAVVEGRSVSDAEAFNLVTMVLVGGLDTVAAMLGFVFRFLAENPDHRRAIAADRSIIPAAVDELLRRYPIAVAGRIVREDYRYGTTDLRKDDMIMLPTLAHGLDLRTYPDGLNVRFERGGVRNATFGAGPHLCPGQFLARTELRIALETWFERVPEFKIADGAEISTMGGIVGLIKELPLSW